MWHPPVPPVSSEPGTSSASKDLCSLGRGPPLRVGEEKVSNSLRCRPMLTMDTIRSLLDGAPERMSVADVMRILGCSRRVVLDLLHSGRIQGFRLGDRPRARWRVPRSALLAFLSRELPDDS